MEYTSLFDVWKNVSEKYSNNIAFTNNNETIKLTYKQAFRMLCVFSQKFSEYGITKGEHVSIFTSNSPFLLMMEQAVINNGGVCITKSPEISLNELGFVYKQSDSSVLITDNKDILVHFIQNGYNLKFIFYVGDYETKDFEKLNTKIYAISQIKELYDENAPVKTDWSDFPEDIAYISYTSGTSSQPKGAMLKNIGLVSVIEQLHENRKGFLPKRAVVTCHISSMGWKIENLLYWSLGCETVYTHYKEFYETIEKFRPHYFEIPPKILQTIYSKLTDYLQKQNFLFKMIFGISFKISDFLLKSSRKCSLVIPLKIIVDNLFDCLVYKKLRRKMFEDNVVMDVGSAPLPRDIEDFFCIIGIDIIQSYGATETTGIAIGNTIQSQRKHPYSVGVAFKYNTAEIVNPETFQKLPNGEIGLLIIKGPAILTGYYKNEEADKKALLPDNYYKTGDLAVKDKDGYITILSRCDDVIVLTNGYNVYTRLLENEVKTSEFVEQIVIIGHSKPYITAIVVLNKTACEKWANEHKFQTENINENLSFKTFLLEHLNDKIMKKEHYKYYEKIRNIYCTFNNFTVENGLIIANTLKIKYSDVIKKYEKEINQMYMKV